MARTGNLLIPEHVAERHRRAIIDSPVERILRGRHIERLATLSERFDDAEYEAAAMGRKGRAQYELFWAERVNVLAGEVAAEPLRKAWGA